MRESFPAAQIDDYGRVFVDPKNVFELIYGGTLPEHIYTDITDHEIAAYNALCQERGKTDEMIQSLNELDYTPEQEHEQRANNWNIPEKFENLDIRNIVINLCESDIERDRVNLEMDMYEERNLLPLLRMMYSLVDHFRRKNIVFGVGRGSSVASYVLFLLRVHSIDSIKYNLDINEFLK